MSTNASTSTSRVYRGRSTAELIPKIQAELGPDAIVIARRSGFEGGIAGFFQRPFVEIEAQRSGGSVDLYDGQDATPELELGSLDALLATPQRERSTSADGLLAAALATSSRTPSSDGAGVPQTPTPRLASPTDGAAIPQSFDSEFASLLALAGERPDAAAPPSTASEAIGERSYDPRGRMRASEASAPADPFGGAPASGAGPAPTPAPAPSSTQVPVPAPTAAPAPNSAPAPGPAPAPQLSTTPTVSPEPVAATERVLAPAATAPVPAAQQPRSKVARAVCRELLERGFDEAFALELIAQANAHVLPFANRIGLRRAVRVALERRIPVARPLCADGGAIALVGPGGSGKTKCAASLAASYRQPGVLPVACASLCEDGDDGLKMVLSPRVTTPVAARSQRALKALAAARREGLVLLDTPAVSPVQTAAIGELGRALREIAPDRTVAMLPATLSARAAAQMLSALAPLRPDAIAFTHAEETDQLGVAVQAACEHGLAPEYALTAARGTRAIERVDPATLATRLLP